MHTHARTHRLAHTCKRAHAHTHTPVAYQGNETEEKVFKKRKVFKEDLKELTEVEWWTETGSLVPGKWSIRQVLCFCFGSSWRVQVTQSCTSLGSAWRIYLTQPHTSLRWAWRRRRRSPALVWVQHEVFRQCSHPLVFRWRSPTLVWVEHEVFRRHSPTLELSMKCLGDSVPHCLASA